MNSSALSYEHHKWHDHFLFLLQVGGNTSTYVWYYDSVGCTGKSSIALHITSCLPSSIRWISDWNDKEDLVSVMADHLDNGWTGEILIIDICRTQRIDDALYICMEGLSNGVLTVMDENPRIVRVPTRTKIFVFCNRLPDIRCASAHRWSDVYCINNRDEIPTKMSLKEIHNQRLHDVSIFDIDTIDV